MYAFGLQGDAVSECLLPYLGNARLEHMVLELRHLQVLSDDLTDRLFVFPFHLIKYPPLLTSNSL